jgi:hypothetical protein
MEAQTTSVLRINRQFSGMRMVPTTMARRLRDERISMEESSLGSSKILLEGKRPLPLGKIHCNKGGLV